MVTGILPGRTMRSCDQCGTRNLTFVYAPDRSARGLNVKGGFTSDEHPFR